MLVLATNHPQNLDPAILDRIDVSLFISLPLYQQRFELTRFYLDMYVCKVALQTQKKRWTLLGRSANGARFVNEDCCSDKVIAGIAALTEGFSGREIAKLFIAAQYAMFNAANGVLTTELLQDVLDFKLRDHKLKSAGFNDSSAGAGPGPGPGHEHVNGHNNTNNVASGGGKHALAFEVTNPMKFPSGDEADQLSTVSEQSLPSRKAAGSGGVRRRSSIK
jgi:hypothetical protein